MSSARGRALGVAVVALATTSAVGCSKTARIEALRDALASGDLDSAKGLGAPSCASAATKDCLSARAAWYGSKSGFASEPPDQASAAAVASMVAEGGALDAVPSTNAWIASAREGRGVGGDALRLAVARALAALAKTWARHVEGDDLGKLAAAVARATPGACRTYALFASGKGDFELADTPDHSACVQRDLGRTHGPGGTYGQGQGRAAAGALAFVRDWADALHDGAKLMDGAPKKALDDALAALDVDLAKIDLEKVEAPAGNAWALGSAQHGTPAPDAGVGALAPKEKK